MNLSSNIKRLRREADLTQEQLAEVLGVSFQSVSKWERGDGMPDIMLLPSIARFFNTTVDDLFNMDEERQKQESKELEEKLWTMAMASSKSKKDSFFEELAIKHPDKVGVNIAFNPQIASLIYAGADLMLMPSRSEPCGLAQMIACRYGTIPVVRKIGGLGDTVKDCRAGEGNGFVFEEYSARALYETIAEAQFLYTYKHDDWINLVHEAMGFDFSWAKSAQIYVDIYIELRTKN